MTKCKKCSMMLLKIKIIWGKQLSGTPEAQRLACSGIQFPGDRIEDCLGELAQITALGQVLPQQTVGILVDAALPGAVLIGEVDLHTGGFRQPLVSRHLSALIICHRQARLRLDTIEHMAEAAQRRCGAGVVHLRQHRKEGGALHQGADCRAVMRSLDEIPLPMPGDQPLFNLWRTVMDADHVRDASAPVFTARTGATLGMAKAQPANHFRAQRATRHGVDRSVDGFVRNPQRRRVGMHKCQCASNLLRRVARFEVPQDRVPQGGSGSQAAHHTRLDRAGTGTSIGSFGAVSACHWRPSRATWRLRSSPAVTTQLPGNARRRAVQTRRNRRRPYAPFQLRLDHRPLFNTQLLVDYSHATLSPNNVALGI